jgi:hypothetical protein
MLREFKIKELGYDFMGYSLQKDDIYTYHHLIIPNREGGKITRENGAILCGKSSHPYLHLIEAKDNELFQAITMKMIEENRQGYLDIQSIRFIDDCLTYFEREHCGERNKKKKLIIKPEYTKRNKF